MRCHGISALTDRWPARQLLPPILPLLPLLLTFLVLHNVNVAQAIRCKQTGMNESDLWFQADSFDDAIGSCSGAICYSVTSKKAAGHQQLALGCGSCADAWDQHELSEKDDKSLDCEECKDKNDCNDMTDFIQKLQNSSECPHTIGNFTVLGFCGTGNGLGGTTKGICAVEVWKGMNTSATDVDFACMADCKRSKKEAEKKGAAVTIQCLECSLKVPPVDPTSCDAVTRKASNEPSAAELGLQSDTGPGTSKAQTNVAESDDDNAAMKMRHSLPTVAVSFATFVSFVYLRY